MKEEGVDKLGPLYCFDAQANTDKEYRAEIIWDGLDFIVTFLWGRRGANLQRGNAKRYRTEARAREAVADQFREKQLKGYRERAWYEQNYISHPVLGDPVAQAARRIENVSLRGLAQLAPDDPTARTTPRTWVPGEAADKPRRIVTRYPKSPKQKQKTEPKKKKDQVVLKTTRRIKLRD